MWTGPLIGSMQCTEYMLYSLYTNLLQLGKDESSDMVAIKWAPPKILTSITNNCCNK